MGGSERASEEDESQSKAVCKVEVDFYIWYLHGAVVNWNFKVLSSYLATIITTHKSPHVRLCNLTSRRKGGGTHAHIMKKKGKRD